MRVRCGGLKKVGGWGREMSCLRGVSGRDMAMRSLKRVSGRGVGIIRRRWNRGKGIDYRASHRELVSFLGAEEALLLRLFLFNPTGLRYNGCEWMGRRSFYGWERSSALDTLVAGVKVIVLMGINHGVLLCLPLSRYSLPLLWVCCCFYT